MTPDALLTETIEALKAAHETLRRATERIIELEEKLATCPNWQTGTPAEIGPYLAEIPGCAGYPYIAHWFEGRWHISAGTYKWVPTSVTHWAPLPKRIAP